MDEEASVDVPLLGGSERFDWIMTVRVSLACPSVCVSSNETAANERTAPEREGVSLYVNLDAKECGVCVCMCVCVCL